MPLLTPALRQHVREILVDLPSPVTLRVFTRLHRDCDSCDDTEQIVDVLAELSDGHLLVERIDVGEDPAKARELGIERVPAIVVPAAAHPPDSAGVRFFGPPAGYEFGTLVETIRLAAHRKTDLQPSTIAALSRLDHPMRIQVFVTPTCPYCPRAALLANQLALASPFVTSDIVDATEFPDLADRYQVRGVPRTVIDETTAIEGAVPESELLAELLPLMQTSG
jgi:glutaredoxin-like protein